MNRVVSMRAPLVLACVLAAAPITLAQPQRPAAAPLVGEMPLPGGVAALLRATHVPGDTDPAVAMQAFIRAVHVMSAVPFAEVSAYLAAISREPLDGDSVPLPLTPEWWSKAVFGRTVRSYELAAAILGDRRAAFMYLGLMSLDDDTLAYCAAHPNAMARVAEQSAGAFAQWGRSIHVSNGRVLVPGGDQAAASWQALVGEPPTDPGRFTVSLLGRDRGRAAFLYDAVSHMDSGGRAFALGSARGADGPDLLKKLYGVVSSTKTIDSEADWPAVRHPFNPVAVLRQIKVDKAGVMTPPGTRGFWAAALSGDARSCSDAARDARPADAGWLVERVEREVLEQRGRWVAAIAFAQRAFAGVPSSELAAACEATAAFPSHDALLLALERIGLERPSGYVDVLRSAAGLWSGSDRRAAVLRTAQAEGIVQVLQQAVSVRTLTSGAARDLLRSLIALQPADGEPLPPGAVGRWLRTTMQPTVCRAQESADGCLIRLVSGAGQRPEGIGRVAWEDDAYTIDLGAAAATRIERVSQAQLATSVEDALALFDAAARVRTSQGESQAAAAAVKAVSLRVPQDFAELFGHPVPAVRQALATIAESLSTSSPDKERTETISSLVTAADVVLADALVSFAYAMAIGDPDDAALIGGNPARRHLFDSTVGPALGPWRLADEVQAVDRSWLIEGAVLMLPRVYSRTWLRRLSMNDPGAAPRPTLQDQRAFGESVTSFTPFALTDAGRDAIVAAIRRGRERLATLIANPASLWSAAETYGLGEWRCRAALWAAARRASSAAGPASNVERFFSLAELMWIGEPTAPTTVIDAWGVTARPLDGSLTVRMPRASTWEDFQGPRGAGLLPTQMADVHLRVAEALGTLKLPAVLAPDVAAQAIWDTMSSAPMAHADDWLALVRAARALPDDRFLDYVSALTAIGPMMPAR